MVNVEQICQDLYDGTNFPGNWHGFDWWGKASDFHEHPHFIWDLVQKMFGDKPLNIVETGRCSGSSTMLFSGIAAKSNGFLTSFDIKDWNRNHIEKMNSKYGVTDTNYKYVVDSSLNGLNHIDVSKKIDILFLDSLHSYEQVKQEHLLFEPYLNDKCLVLFHDTTWCFDTVMGWCLDYLADKNVIFAKSKDTDKPQCEYCDRFNKPNMLHGRPCMQSSGRPNFQSPYDIIEESPHFNTLNYDKIKWSKESFENCFDKKKSLIFTNIEACCGMGVLVRNP